MNSSTIKRLGLLIAIALTLAGSLVRITATVASSLPLSASASTSALGKPIPDHYIVMVKPGRKAREVAAITGVTPNRVYDAAFNGFAGRLTAGQLTALQRHADVVVVEPDQEVTADVTQSMGFTDGQPWGLDRIDQRALPLSKTYTYDKTGSGVHVYIIDSGIQTNHPQFQATFFGLTMTSASADYDAFGGNGQDCHGHGTHVAATVGGRTYGVAKATRLHGIRVLDCTNRGSLSGIIAGIDWVIEHKQAPAVANISIGASFSGFLNTAVRNLVNAGVFTAVSAGNDNTDACLQSPASAANAYTVASSDNTDTRASSSNFGTCVDGYAPGVAIKSAWINSSTAVQYGTSMASPHVAGVAALYKSTFGDAPSATITTWINTNASANVIKNNPAGTPNRLLYKAGL